ncbi:MAG: c-type cytochrome [Verrucomicrobiaceae bacterium]|nr:c-type cytochrome [Verrucomicrobiaceae bacterium]
MGRRPVMKRLLLVFFSCGLHLHAAPHWVQPVDGTKGFHLTQSFQVPEGIKSARLRMVADFVDVQLSINESKVAVCEMFGPVVEMDVRSWLQAGQNEISLLSVSQLTNPAPGNARSGKEEMAKVRPLSGDAVVALELVITDDSNKETLIATSPRWQGVKSLGDLGLEKWWHLPPLVIGEADDYTQWKRAGNAKAGTDPATFKLLPGYKAELLRSAGGDEGSWVSLAFDPEGRLTVAREDKGLIRYTFSPDYSRIIKAESINDELKECRGLLYAHGSLYANANNSKGLYRLRDSNGDGSLDEQKLLHASEGGVGHGRNDLSLGPDGKIYAIHGDSVQMPKGITDLTSSLRRNFKAFRNNEGHVLRMDPDGSNREIFCGGLRNPYGIAFNADGEAFTYDADAEFDMGNPWYRPTRVNHLTSGADFGWRALTGNWPPYYPDHPDNTQPMLDIGKGSPTGVKFGTKSHFPPDYRKALFILDWTYGRILAVHMRPRGSTYMGAAEVFLRGQPLNVTDLGFGPDGAMYFVTGGRKTKSALYRVTYTGPVIKPRALTKAESNREKRAREFRRERKSAESHHGLPTEFVFAGFVEPRIRHAWRIALEENRRAQDREDQLNFENLTAEFNVSLGTGSPEVKLIDEWTKLLPSEQLAYIDLIARNMKHHNLEAKVLAAIRANLEPHFPGHSPAMNQVLAPLLISLDPAKAVGQTIRLLNQSIHQRERLHYLYHLRNAREGWTADSRGSFFRALGTYDTFLGGRGLPQALKNIRREAMATLTEDEKVLLAGVIEHKPAIPGFPDLTGRQLIRQWQPADFKGALDFDAATRDVANGKKVFTLALCSRCHRHGRNGYPVGPDLSHVAGRFTRSDILAEILNPSRSIAPNYRASVLQLKDGRRLSGQIIANLDYRVGDLQLAQNPLYPDKITRIKKGDIISRGHSGVSLMPAGLLNRFSKGEILDLLAWLENAH